MAFGTEKSGGGAVRSWKKASHCGGSAQGVPHAQAGTPRVPSPLSSIRHQDDGATRWPPHSRRCRIHGDMPNSTGISLRNSGAVRIDSGGLPRQGPLGREPMHSGRRTHGRQARVGSGPGEQERKCGDALPSGPGPLGVPGHVLLQSHDPQPSGRRGVKLPELRQHCPPSRQVSRPPAA